MVITQREHTVAIKIAGSPIISDTREFTNISNVQGIYGNLHASPSSVSSNITLSNSIQTCIMTAAQTFTISGGDEGRTTALLLDTGSAGHDPTFPASILWTGGEPTWANSRYWQITILSRDTYQVGTGIGYAGSSPAEAVSLGGTTANPITNVDTTGISPFEAGWRFKADGNVYKWQHPNNAGGDGETLYSTSTWNNITPSQTYYIRASNYSGSVNLNVSQSSTINSWIALTSTREFVYYDSRTPSSYGDENGVMKIEISSSSGGSPILATGYYQVDYNGLA